MVVSNLRKSSVRTLNFLYAYVPRWREEFDSTVCATSSKPFLSWWVKTTKALLPFIRLQRSKTTCMLLWILIVLYTVFQYVIMEADLMGYSPPLSLWRLVEQHVQPHERDEIKSMLGVGVVDETLELHDELEAFLEIWRDCRCNSQRVSVLRLW